MRNRPDWDTYFLMVARVIAERSPDEETQVGCVIVDGAHRIIAAGYNGFPPGSPDAELPATRPDKYPYMIHAEVNAMVSSKADLRGATLYCTHSPCGECAKAIATAGISSVIYDTPYAGIELTKRILYLAKIGVRRVGG